jgi:hypothetical protein
MRGPRRFRAARQGLRRPWQGFFKWLFLYPFLFGVAVMVLQAVVMAAL